MRTLAYSRIAAGLLLAAVAGCGGDGSGGTTGPNTGPVAAAIAALSGDGQTAQRGNELGQPLVVRVTDSQGNAVSGVTVEWTVSGAGGSLSSSSGRTNSQGQASVELTLSFAPGQSTVTASAAGVAQAADFTVTATDPGPLTITIEMLNTQFVTPLGGDDITIKLGDTVQWVNRDGVQHTATSNSVPAGGSAFDSGLLSATQTFSFTPGVAGTWVYFCQTHPTTMQGARITVVQ